MMKNVIYAVAASMALIGMSGCAGMRGARYERRMVGKPAPDFQLTSLDGAEVKLSDYRGKPVIVAFFGHG